MSERERAEQTWIPGDSSKDDKSRGVKRNRVEVVYCTGYLILIMMVMSVVMVMMLLLR